MSDKTVLETFAAVLAVSAKMVPFVNCAAFVFKSHDDTNSSIFMGNFSFKQLVSIFFFLTSLRPNWFVQTHEILWKKQFCLKHHYKYILAAFNNRSNGF